MTEHQLVTALLKTLRAGLVGFVVQKHSDRATFGRPDISVTGFGRTTWWEVKRANPDFDSIGIQDLTCKRLDSAGYCRYIIFSEDADGTHKLTTVVRPRYLERWKAEFEFSTEGFNHAWLLERIRKAHV